MTESRTPVPCSACHGGYILGQPCRFCAALSEQQPSAEKEHWDGKCTFGGCKTPRACEYEGRCCSTSSTQAALSEQQPAAMSGWKWVPIEPNEYMLGMGKHALYKASDRATHATYSVVRACFEAMIAAAPEAASKPFYARQGISLEDIARITWEDRHDTSPNEVWNLVVQSVLIAQEQGAGKAGDADRAPVQPSPDMLDARRTLLLAKEALELAVQDGGPNAFFSTTDEKIDAAIAAIDAMLSAKETK